MFRNNDERELALSCVNTTIEKPKKKKQIGDGQIVEATGF